MKKLLFRMSLGLAIASGCGATYAAPQWVDIGTSITNDRWQLDANSLKHEGSKELVWARVFFGKPNGKIASSLQKFQISCDDMNSVVLQAGVLYDARGGVIHNDDHIGVRMSAPPGSVYEKIAQLTCSMPPTSV